jgi:signal transduction histidine kinase
MEVLERLAGRVGTGANIALGVALAAVLALDAIRSASLNVATAPGHVQWRLNLGVGLVICATALLRARGRTWAAAIGLTVFGLAAAAAPLWDLAPQPKFGGALFGLLVLGAAAVRSLPPRRAAIVGACGLVVITASECVQVNGSLSFDGRALSVLIAATLWAGALAVGLWLRYLDLRHQQLLEATRRAERLELARELHDVVAHHVTGMVVQAQAARFVGEQHPASLTAALGSIESAGADTLSAIRQLVGLLRDPDDTSSVSPAAEPIGRLVERFARHGPPVDLRLPAGPPAPGWPPQVASTVYRVVQEALTNIARHAPGARSVTVTITHDPERVGIEITDDAPATAPRHGRLGGGYGLAGMRERVEALGGKIQAGPRPEAGWGVRASLPVAAPGRP